MIKSNEHEVIRLQSTFEAFDDRLQRLAGKFDESIYALEDFAADTAELEIHQMEGEQGLMIFNINDHGKLLQLLGYNRKIKQYNIGNPVIAASMTHLKPPAALYAPLRVVLYEDEYGTAFVEYDLPSLQFAQFGNDEVAAVGRSLDEKLAILLAKADKAVSSTDRHP